MMLRTLSILATAATLLVISACGSGKITDPDIQATTFAPSLGVNLTASTRTESGLYYQDLQVGGGTVARAGFKVTVHYTGWLVDGEKFDSSIDRGQPLTFTLGIHEVIDGWDEGIAGMREGGTRKLIIPPSLGYGSRQRGPIPPNSILVFDVKLLSVQP